MPELPEVETIKRALALGGRGGASILNRRITAAHIYWPRTLASPDVVSFIDNVKEQQIVNIQRRAKFLVINLDHSKLIIHLRMSGDIRVAEQVPDLGSPLLPHDRLALVFENNSAMIFNDTRKFGRVWLTQDPLEILGELGPEPLDESLRPEQFWEMLQKFQRQLKPLLMDQHFLAGMGNIYTDEALFKAKLHPLTLSSRLSLNQAALLLSAIRSVLNEGIRRNGASIDWVYRGGDFQNAFNVYQKDGEPCPVCGTIIQRMVVGQRGTHFCPNCQRESIN
ncbi:MAG: DNA-formamidopyrimidine glycosylase [Anaerolineae bacterium]|nr:DNA-formamidopyrimidine glycosylase [Anaerolineae bacterium]